MNSQAWMLLLGSYIIGSIPTAYLLVKFITGEDIRFLGDGNVGAKNTSESVGNTIGFLVAGVDIGKGFLAITTARNLGFGDNLVLLAGAFVVIGHDFSIFLGFQGGQGMAATVGVFGALFPQMTLLAFVVFLICLTFTRNWDLSCGIAFFLLVAGIWLTDQPTNQVVFCMLLLPWIAFSKFIQKWRSHRVAI
jgi:glycerol-3-phosphate acyltransferase PlsY